MLEYWYSGLCIIILLTIFGGLPRIIMGPSKADRMLAAQLSGSASVAIILLLAHKQKEYYLYDVALLFALLAAVTVVSFVRLAWHRKTEPHP